MRGRGSGDAGFIGGAEALLIGVLVFVCGSLLIVNLWGTLDAKIAVTSAAQQAARAFADAPDAATAGGQARAAADEVLAAHGRRATAVVIAGEFQRCARVIVTVSSNVPGVSLGWLGRLGSRTVSSRASGLVDPYRSDANLPGGSCV